VCRLSFVGMGPLHGLPVLRVVADWLLVCVLCADSMLGLYDPVCRHCKGFVVTWDSIAGKMAYNTLGRPKAFKYFGDSLWLGFG